MRRTSILGLLLAAPALPQDAERAFLVVDPDDAESRYVANHYIATRGIPDRNLLYMDPAASSYVEWTDVQAPGFRGTLRNAGVEETVDFVVIPPGERFFMPAGGLVDDLCFPVHRFAVPSCFTLVRQREQISGGTDSNDTNHYEASGYGPRAFQSRLSWFLGGESTSDKAERYFLGAMLGWTGHNGNTLSEVLDTIDRSAAVDGTQPVGTFFFCETTDQARSGPRHDAYPTAVDKITGGGGSAQHLLANLPLGHHDCLGVMTGLANPDITSPDFSLLPGAFADHLTSYAGTFDNDSQTKMSEWITKGASGTAGTIEEPCNYPGKFPHARMHVVYYRGLTLGEAWFRSHGFRPYQSLLLGDPLTRPFGWLPDVDVPSPPLGPQSGFVTITPTASAGPPSADIVELTLFVDGKPLETITGGSFTLDTTLLADGWHELRVRAVDSRVWRNQDSWVGELEVDNLGRSVTLNAAPTAGDLGTLLFFDHAAAGGTVDHVVLLRGEQVVASSDQAAGQTTLYGQNLGAGAVRVRAEARFADGTAARSASVDLDLAFAGGGTGAAAPVAFDFSVRVREDEPFVLALPAAFDDDPATVTTEVLSHPAQSALLGGEGSWRVYEPSPTALGSDGLTYRVTGAGGTSNTGTVTLEYQDVDGCDPIQRYCIGAPNSVGSGAEIDFQGSVSVSANDLVLTASGAPPDHFGLFFHGEGQVQTSLGDGFLCIGSNLVRLPVVKTDAGGGAVQPIDVVAAGFAPGDTRSFQFWYRDPNFGGAGSNLSDALEATFCN